MSPYRYRCHRCRMTSDSVSTQADAETLRALHRTAAHSGGTPDGIEEIADSRSPARDWWMAVLLVGLVAFGALILFVRWLRHL